MVVSLFNEKVKSDFTLDHKITGTELTETLKKLTERLGRLQQARAPFDGDFEDIADHIRPHSFKKQVNSEAEKKRGFKGRGQRLNEVAFYASRTARAGMHTGASSPARPWFQLDHPDPEAAKSLAVKQWLSPVESSMYRVMQRSNLYKSMPQTYGNLLDYGIGALVALPDEDDVVRFYPKTMGTFVVSTNKRGIVDTYGEEMLMTVRQVVEQFGIDAVSRTTREMYHDGKLEENIVVCWLIDPNKEYDPDKIPARFKKYRSVYWEKDHDQSSGLLEISGFDVFPVLVPRWEPTSDSAYSHDFPGLGALDICKQLKEITKQLSVARELGIRPPLNVNPKLRGISKGIIPGFVNYTADSNEDITPTLKAHIDTRGTLDEKAELERSLQQMYFQDIFLMIANEQRNDITATEIIARQQERMMVLGPVLSGLDDEFFDPLIDIVYYYMDLRGMIPEPPPELDGVKLKVEYISILAQAQKATDVGKVDRAIASIYQLAEADPTALDNLDFDKAADRYFDLYGETDIQRSKDAVEKKRKAREEAQAQQAQLEASQSLAATAETLSKTDPAKIQQLVQGNAV